jgi:DNA-binding MarR family transcriptional regulator
MPVLAPSTMQMTQLLGAVKDQLLDDMRDAVAAAGFPEIRAAHSCVFRYLHPDGTRLSDMAEQARMTKQAFAEHVDYLEQHGYVRRVPDPEDGRAKLVVPTAKGAEALRVAHASFRRTEAAWAQQVGADRVAELRATLEALVALPSE